MPAKQKMNSGQLISPRNARILSHSASNKSPNNPRFGRTDAESNRPKHGRRGLNEQAKSTEDQIYPGGRPPQQH